MSEVFVVFLPVHHGRIPLRVCLSKGSAEAWCIDHAERSLKEKSHPRSGVRPVYAGELGNLGYDIFSCPMEE